MQFSITAPQQLQEIAIVVIIHVFSSYSLGGWYLLIFSTSLTSMLKSLDNKMSIIAAGPASIQGLYVWKVNNQLFVFVQVETSENFDVVDLDHFLVYFPAVCWTK